MYLYFTAAIVAAAALIWIGVRIRRWYSPSARQGRRGERRVRRELRHLPRRDFIVLNDLMLPLPSPRSTNAAQRYTQIDHVVISTRGIFIIETKALMGHIQGSEESQYWQQRFLMKSLSFYNPLLQNATHIKAVRRLVRELPEESFVSIVVFTEAWRIDVLTEDLVSHRRWWPSKHIRRTLDPERTVKARWWSRHRGVQLDERKMVMRLGALSGELRRRPRIIHRDDLAEIARRLEQANVRGRGERRAHTSDVRRTARDNEQLIRSGHCPRCGGELRLREGKNGPFFGCSNYPQCRFSCEAIS
ncbi:MAG: NERD domain-containing protein [Muribaculaceae bacterium]|nr:NERD domain-containing protein [Muribaculaceae bacterium]